MTLPDPSARHPLILPDGTAHPGTVHLGAVIDHPNIDVGVHTYAHAFEPPDNWASRLAPYLFPGAPERLVIGKFCQIANGVTVVTATANHTLTGLTTYPFGVFDPGRFGAYRASLPAGQDVIVGKDCWLGYGATLLPKARLGNGVIVGAGAVVAGDVPDYAIVAGNPATVVRMRFSPTEIATLNQLAWWDWPGERIKDALPLLEAGDVAGLAEFAAL
ncbi:MAG: CatB-related O-acetyltransferase [Pseudomonadota bacterium]